LQIDPPPGSEGAVTLLRKLSHELIQYYAAWLSGGQSEFNTKPLLAKSDEFKDGPYVRLLSGQLAGMDPNSQIELLDLLAEFGAAGATEDILALLHENPVAKVQEACLETLRRLGTCRDIEPFREFLTSRRQVVQDAAARLVGEIGGEAAAELLINLEARRLLRRSPALVEAMARTKAPTSLAWLLQLIDEGGELSRKACIVVAECLREIPIAEWQADPAWSIGPDWLASLCERLAGRDDPWPRLLALRLVDAFALRQAFPVVQHALEGGSIRIRIAAIEAAARFRDDTVADLIARCAAQKPEDYESARLVELMMAITESRQRDGPKVGPRSRADLDLERVALRALRAIGTPHALKLAAGIKPSASEAVMETEGTEPGNADESTDLLAEARRAAREITIYSLPKGIRVWLESTSEPEENGDDLVSATTIHPDGVVDYATGRRSSILRDIVAPYQCGERPAEGGPGNVFQDEAKTIDFKTGEVKTIDFKTGESETTYLGQPRDQVENE